MKQKNLVKVGGLRQETSADGQPYFVCRVRDERLIVFVNGNKTEDAEDDFIIYARE